MFCTIYLKTFWLTIKIFKIYFSVYQKKKTSTVCHRKRTSMFMPAFLCVSVFSNSLILCIGFFRCQLFLLDLFSLPFYLNWLVWPLRPKVSAKSAFSLRLRCRKRKKNNTFVHSDGDLQTSRYIGRSKNPWIKIIYNSKKWHLLSVTDAILCKKNQIRRATTTSLLNNEKRCGSDLKTDEFILCGHIPILIEYVTFCNNKALNIV